MLRVWCLHHVMVIGAIVHGYFQVDWDELWNVVERELRCGPFEKLGLRQSAKTIVLVRWKAR